MSQTSSQSPDSWIGQFCNLVGHEYFAEVSEDFIEDDFNLTGLQAQVPMYKDALEMILDVEPSETNSSELSEEEEEEEEEEDDGLLGDELDEPAQNGATRQPGLAAGGRRHGRSSSDTSVIESSAELLYGLIHSRYITSRPGIQQMMEKYELTHFGYCPRVYCAGTKVLPVGLTDTPGQQTVKLFCPSCLDVYTPPNSRFQAVDGAFFGTTFPYLFLMSYPDLEIAPLKKRAPRDSVGQANDDVESTLSPTENASRGGMTASRSSSLTLPQPPAIPGVTATKDEKPLIPNNAVPSLPPQPATINGFATNNLAPGLGKGKIYEPKIYGFRVSERAKSGPRMKWLRSKPADVNELDEARIWHERYGGTVDGDPDEEPGATSGEMEDEDAEDELADADGDAIMGSQSQNNGKGRSKRGDASGITQGPARGKAKRKSAQQAGQPESENWI
ncbi:casein kinase 2 regulatory subunit [Exophiala sideris]|uniref:Casein kinase II subunit beta n=1 Tax=Exophiala sideris TaxID=1016849 RepID=A0ABR0IVN3_9EURO|nr:casein kinase 2 regulatory subunit [Exophiala sideris]KAK5049664.1 casein kinase 2 regulatory subunit [Exophiala sideris]KAK5176645.1 casein kinase 2 regulatory subunit [Eurotiomycetes sp. CCFEE 6388]